MAAVAIDAYEGPQWGRERSADVAAAAPGAEGPPVPLWNYGLGAVSLGHLGGIGLDPVATRLHHTQGQTRVSVGHSDRMYRLVTGRDGGMTRQML